MPKVSVILPVFNVDKFLNNCIDTILNQTLKDIEVICVNDGSTDKSLEILEEYAQIDNRIIIINQENQGQGVARNRGIEIAKGEYLQFIDPDDWVRLDMLEILYNFAKENNSQIIKCDYKKYYDYTQEYKKINFAKKIKKEYNYDLIKTPYYTWNLLKKDCLSNLELHSWSYFYLTEFVKSNNIQFAPSKHGEDHLFVNSAMLLANRIDYLNKNFYRYRIRNGSTVQTKSDINFCVFQNIELLKDFLIQNNYFEELKEEWRTYSQKVIIWHYKLIPNENIKKYKELALEYFDSPEEFISLKKVLLKENSFLENIFSIKNREINGIKYKAITLLGFTLNIKPTERIREPKIL